MKKNRSILVTGLKLICIIILLLPNCVFANSCNIIENGAFQNGTTSWTTFTHANADGNISLTADGFCKLEVIDGSTNTWHLALRQNNLLLENGKSYTLSYTAYAEADRNISIILSEQTGTQYSYHAQALTTVSTSYSHSFMMNAATDLNSILS